MTFRPAFFRIVLAGLAASCLGGCILDLYGGVPRIQLRNSTTSYRIESVGLGPLQNPTWSHALDPALKPEALSEVVDLPSPGTFDLVVRASLDQDTFLVRTRLDVSAGDYRRLEITEDETGLLHLK